MTDDFDTDLMAMNTRPFSSYIEPVGYEKIKTRVSMRDEDYIRWVPITHRIGHAMYRSLTQVDCWGKQVTKWKGRDDETGGWVQETRRLPARAKYGGDRPGIALDATDILKSLSRPAYYAVGRTDKCLEADYGSYGAISFPVLQVNCLCLDVDMDVAWESGDVGTVRHEVWRESQIAQAMGLPYRAFVTGGRGHQCILPFPTLVDRSVASWLLTAYEGILRPWHLRDGAADADISNLDKLVRIAGGRHIKTGRLALWIDPVAGRLHDLPMQITLMETGYRTPELDPIRRELFGAAAEEIARYLYRQSHVPRSDCLPPMACDTIVAATLRDLPDNALVESVLAAQALYALANDNTLLLVNPKATVPNTPQPAGTQIQSDASYVNELSSLTPDALRVWAERVWAIEWGEGTYWDWINEAGARGITAAKLLFGGDALNKLLARTLQAPHTTPGEPAEWRRSITALYAKHRMQSFESADALRLAHGTLCADGQVLVPIIAEAMHSKNRILPRNRPDVEHLIRLLLIALQDAETGCVDLSLDTLHAALRMGRINSTMSRSGIQRHLLRLRDDKPECGYAMLDEIVINRSGQNMATRYRPGAALRATAFGLGLTIDDTADYVPLDEPIRTRVRTLAGLQWREKTSKPRGRKRRETQGKGEEKEEQ